MRQFLQSLLLWLISGWLVVGMSTASEHAGMRLRIDARELPRKLLSAEIDLDISEAERTTEGDVVLWYPKWVPGSHGPGGPVANLAGLRILAADGEPFSWQRTPGEVYRIEVAVPETTEQVTVCVRYITNQPTANSIGHDSFGTPHLGIIGPATVLFYPAGIDIDQILVETTLQIPPNWRAATALDAESQTIDGSENMIRYPPVSLRKLVDSPILCGRYHNRIELAADDLHTPPHSLHLFSEFKSAVELPEAMRQRLDALVIQTGHAVGSHPFARFEFLLAATDQLPKNGLEHSRSSLNVLGSQTLQSPDRLKGWDRLLIPHEYLHAWCGKYRRPVGMLTSDFHTPKSTELLWVYEGLTQYLGEVLEARAGWMSPEEFLDRVAVEVRRANQQQGRQWRTLADTAASSHVLRGGSRYWAGLRRSQDYYMEGMLFWLEADAIIRTRSQNSHSLDDFCHRFFAYAKGMPHPSAYDRSEVVAILDELVDFDWDGLIRRRIESVGMLDIGFVELLGYEIVHTDDDRSIPGHTFRLRSGLDALDSIGCVLTDNGTVGELLLDSPAYLAGLGPGSRILTVGEHTWSRARMREALAQSSETGKIELGVVDGDTLRPVEIDYDDGLRYMQLRRRESLPDLIEAIVQPR